MPSTDAADGDAEPPTRPFRRPGSSTTRPSSRDRTDTSSSGASAATSSGPGTGRTRNHHRAGSSGTARHGQDRGAGHGRKQKKKGSFWRELPILIVVALVLTVVIQTFVGRPYEIPSGSMETTLHGCSGCTNDRVAADKMTYRFTDPAPGDVVIFRGPPAWTDNDESSAGTRSDNAVVRTFQNGLAIIGFAAPDEKDFVKRVIATGGQTVACCDNRNRVTVNGQPLTEPYIFYQPDRGPARQEPFDPVTVPPGMLWVMGDNRNNSADARAHGPVPVDDVIGKARAVILPVTRWRSVPGIDPQVPG